MAKSNLQYFQNDWNKTVNWANTQKISKSQWYPVYQLDLQRYANGEYPMSQAERARAILSSASLDAQTVLPTDNPSPTNIIGNTLTDARNIFTGLSGFVTGKAEGNIWDELKNTFEHPSWDLDPTKNTLLQWLPGWADLGELEQGGLSRLASHPLVSLLDVLPLSDSAIRLAAKTGPGAAIAERAGMTPDEMATVVRKGGQGSTFRVARGLVGNTENKLTSFLHLTSKSTGFEMTPAELAGKLQSIDPASDEKILQKLTVGERWKQMARAKGMSREQADLMAGSLEENVVQTRLNTELTKPLQDAISKLGSDGKDQFYQLLKFSGRSSEDLINDPSIPVNVLQAIKAYQGFEGYAQDIVLSSRDFAPIKLPDGTEDYFSSRPNHPVKLAKDQSDKDITALDTGAAESDRIAADIKQADTTAQPIFGRLQTHQQVLYQSVKTISTDASDAPINADLVGRLFEQDEPANKFQIQAVEDIFAPGGLIDRLRSTYSSGDWKAYRSTALQLIRKFSGESFRKIGPDLAMVRHLANQIYEYSKFRATKETEFTKAFAKVAPLQKAATKSITAFQQAVIKNPPVRFMSLFTDLYITNLLRHDKGSEFLDNSAKYLATKGVPKSTLDELRSNPRVLYELVNQISKNTFTDIMSGLMDRQTAQEIIADTYENVARMRAEGFVPHYIPNVKYGQAGDEGSYNIYISSLKAPVLDASFEKMMDYTDSIYDIQAGVSKFMKQSLGRNGTLHYMDNDVQQHLFPVQDIHDLFLREYPLLQGIEQGSRDALWAKALDEWNLTPYDSQGIFGYTSARVAKDGFLINKDLARTLHDIANRDQGIDKSFGVRGTQIFRMAVLGYSPRFIAHIVFGGSFLVALRISPHAFRFIGDAYRMAKEGTHESLRTSTQQGADPVNFQIIKGFRAGGTQAVDAAEKNLHWWGGVKMRNLVLHEYMDSLGLDSTKLSSWLQVLPSYTFKLTNFVTNMQRALVYLDGAATAERRGWFIDENGVRNDTMTAARAHQEGMIATERVMGDLRHMTPLERHTFTKIMPFYGWTKHILKYVSSYPSDHPYRAMFLSNMANMNSEDVPSGLPTRIQLLFFLGSPNADGSIETDDVRALNPLRDTANYATWGGILSSLNPGLTAIPAIVDPSIIFGDNVLYPNLQYNQLYGIKEAAPSGNALTAAEQYVPELTALDVALGLSSQYRNLRKTDPAGFAKKIFESLGLPFTPEKINVRQIAATGEIDRYQQASQAALNAWQSGDFGPLAGYPTVPDPLQPDYNITPMALEALYNNALAATGQPPSEVVPSLPAPNI